MVESSHRKDVALLVHVNFSVSDAREELAEFQELALSAGVVPAKVVTVNRTVPDAKYFIGSGKALELKAMLLEEQADLVLVNHVLSAGQERNLERLLNCRVLDRIGLILDIFAQRARTFEGQLQVELAQLEHLSTRLVRGWTHLERQKGGIGLRGPGETQLETDRRLIRQRIKTLKQRLEKVRQQRQQGRQARSKVPLATVSLVGYTNAGKSTLFNCLTGADVYVANQLFATLDPTLRQLQVPHLGHVILADTVGFIRHLPHTLIDAFRATLEETRLASLLIHVIDASDPAWEAHAQQVNEVLHEIGVTGPILQVRNKIDCLPNCPARLERDDEGIIQRVWLSAHTGVGLPYLMQSIAERLCGEMVQTVVCLKPSENRIRALLYELHAVEAEHIETNGDMTLSIRMPRDEYERLFGNVSEG